MGDVIQRNLTTPSRRAELVSAIISIANQLHRDRETHEPRPPTNINVVDTASD
jgi:hypothetical protein